MIPTINTIVSNSTDIMNGYVAHGFLSNPWGTVIAIGLVVVQPLFGRVQLWPRAEPQNDVALGDVMRLAEPLVHGVNGARERREIFFALASIPAVKQRAVVRETLRLIDGHSINGADRSQIIQTLGGLSEEEMCVVVDLMRALTAGVEAKDYLISFLTNLIMIPQAKRASYIAATLPFFYPQDKPFDRYELFASVAGQYLDRMNDIKNQIIALGGEQMDGSERAQLIRVLGSIGNFAETVAIATPLLKNMKSGLHISSILETILTIPKESRAQLLATASLLCPETTSVAHRLVVIKALRTATQTEIEQAIALTQRVTSDVVIAPDILELVLKSPQEKRQQLVEEAQQLFTPETAGAEKIAIVKALQNSTPAEVRETLAALVPLFDTQIAPTVLVAVLKTPKPVRHQLMATLHQIFAVVPKRDTRLEILKQAQSFKQLETYFRNHTLIVTRESLHQSPRDYIRFLALFPDIKIKVDFAGEEAVDAGGPWREFIAIIFQELVKDDTLFTGPVGQRIPLNRDTQLPLYRAIGTVLGTLIRRKDATVGALFHEDLFHAIVGDSDEMRIAALLRKNCETAFALLKKEAWDDKDRNYADTYYAAESLQELRETLFEALPVAPLLAMAEAIRSQATNPPEAVMRQLQGICDPRDVVASCILRDATNVSVRQQFEWLKAWILKSPENAEKLVRFATGATTLIPGSEIKLFAHDGQSLYPTANTCFNEVILSKQPFSSQDEFEAVLNEAVMSQFARD